MFIHAHVLTVRYTHTFICPCTLRYIFIHTHIVSKSLVADA